MKNYEIINQLHKYTYITFYYINYGHNNYKVIY